MSKKEMEFLYTGVQANCEDDMCHKCHEKDGGGGLQTSVIVLLVLFLVSVLANILLLGWLISKTLKYQPIHLCMPGAYK